MAKFIKKLKGVISNPFFLGERSYKRGRETIKPILYLVLYRTHVK